MTCLPPSMSHTLALLLADPSHPGAAQKSVMCERLWLE